MFFTQTLVIIKKKEYYLNIIIWTNYINIMRKHFNSLTTILLLLLFISTLNAQTENREVKGKSDPFVGKTLNDGKEFRGIILDSENKTPLLYTTIYILNTNRGTISNELGHFTINISGLNKTDTLGFQFVGYKSRTISLGELLADSVIYLKEEFVNLSEFLVFATEPDAEAIVKKVVKNKKTNYRKTTSKKQTFIRLRDNLIMDDFSFDYKKVHLLTWTEKRLTEPERKSQRIPHHILISWLISILTKIRLMT